SRPTACDCSCNEECERLRYRFRSADQGKFVLPTERVEVTSDHGLGGHVEARSVHRMDSALQLWLPSSTRASLNPRKIRRLHEDRYDVAHNLAVRFGLFLDF